MAYSFIFLTQALSPLANHHGLRLLDDQLLIFFSEDEIRWRCVELRTFASQFVRRTQLQVAQRDEADSAEL